MSSALCSNNSFRWYIGTFAIQKLRRHCSAGLLAALKELPGFASDGLNFLVRSASFAVRSQNALQPSLRKYVSIDSKVRRKHSLQSLPQPYACDEMSKMKSFQR